MNTEAKQLEEEWVINTANSSYKPRPTLSNAANLMIKAALPNNRQRNLSHEAAPFVPKRISTDDPIESLAKESLPTDLTDFLVTTYINEKPDANKAQKAATHEAHRKSMKNGLLECNNPVGLILQSIQYLARFPTDHISKKAVSERCLRTVARLLCESMDEFIHCVPKEIGYRLLGMTFPPPTPIEDEKALIDFDDHHTISSKEPDLIVFKDVDATQSLIDSEEVTHEDDKEDPQVITIADLQRAEPNERAWRKKFITEEHQLQCLSMIDEEIGPILIYLCIKTFRLSTILAAGEIHEDLGVTLIRRLIQTECQLEALHCLETFRMIDRFSFEELVIPIISKKDTGCVLKLASLSDPLRDDMLSFIDTQLKYTMNGNLGIVSEERLNRYITTTDSDPPPMADIYERKVQKELANLAIKIMDTYSIDHKTYLFVYLTHRYVSLRWLISQRACQQVEENDYSLEASSNYNGLIYVLCHQDESLMRLAVKEFIDMRDPYAAPYFAEKFNQQAFYDQYLAMPMSQRVIGSVAGEQNSRSRVYMPRKKKKVPTEGVAIYQLPMDVQLVIIDNSEGLAAMRTLLRQSRLCGLDTEWIPHLAKDDCTRTSLMQVGSEVGVVFLLDMVKLSGYNNPRVGFEGYYGPQPESTIHQQTFQFLIDLFSDERIIKLAYDFRGDIDMLSKTFPQIKDVNMESFVDFANLNSIVEDKEDSDIPKPRGGLTGVVETFLNRSLNKKQQLSNWEQRPLTDEQTKYAAGDAYCLIEIFYVLCNINHPILWDETLANGPAYL